jgi:hypothetical protein
MSVPAVVAIVAALVYLAAQLLGRQVTPATAGVGVWRSSVAELARLAYAVALLAVMIHLAGKAAF